VPGTLKTYKARGIVLNSLKYGDSAMVVHLLTDALGRQSYMVQGVRSSRGRGSKLALFQPMFALEFERRNAFARQHVSVGRQDAEVQSGIVLQRMPFDVRRSTIALFMAEVLYRLVKESEPDSQLFDFVWESIGALDSMEEGVANFHLWFLVNLSRFLGFYPGNEYMPGAWFDACEGSYTVQKPPHATVMTPENARLMNDFVECDVRCLAEIGLNRTQRSAFLEALLAYYGYHLDAIHAVQSVRILQEVF
jgi:DNA repair protein RecO (recombination protein O)